MLTAAHNIKVECEGSVAMIMLMVNKFRTLQASVGTVHGARTEYLTCHCDHYHVVNSSLKGIQAEYF